VKVVVLEIASPTAVLCSYTNIADRHRFRAAIDHRQNDLVRPRLSWISPSRRDVLVRAVFHRNSRPAHNCQPERPDIRDNRQNKSRNTQRAGDRHVRQPYGDRNLLRPHCGPSLGPQTARRAKPLVKFCGAKGIRTPDLLDANESRYQLRHSP
jgi:hypothetical protein